MEEQTIDQSGEQQELDARVGMEDIRVGMSEEQKQRVLDEIRRVLREGR